MIYISLTWSFLKSFQLNLLISNFTDFSVDYFKTELIKKISKGCFPPFQIKQRESSVTVKPDWIVIEEIEKTQLGKMNLPNVSEPEDL